MIYVKCLVPENAVYVWIEQKANTSDKTILKIPGYIRARPQLQKIDLGLRAQFMISKSNVKVYVLMNKPWLIRVSQKPK